MRILILAVVLILLTCVVEVKAQNYVKNGDVYEVTTVETVDGNFIEREINRLNKLIAENESVIVEAKEQRDYLINLIR